MFEPARTRGLRPAGMVTLLILPAVLAGLVVWALWTPSERLSDTQAAIVNNDEPVTVNGQSTPVGRSLAGNLIDNTTNNYTWALTNGEDARQGLASGEYAAVLTIPKDFSANVVSVADPDPSNATKATITIETTTMGGILDPSVSKAITEASTAAFTQQLGQNYLQNVYASYNTINDSFGQAADGAGQLADGASQTNDGALQVDNGAQALADGLVQLQAGAAERRDGAVTLAAGTETLKNGTASVADGAAALSTGLGELATRSTDLSDSAKRLATGSGDVADLASTLASSAIEAERATVRLAGEATVVAGRQAALATFMSELADDCAASGAEPAYCLRVRAAQERASLIATAGERLSTNARQLAVEIGRLAVGARAVADASTLASRGADAVATGASALAAGADEASRRGADLAEGAKKAADGAADTNTGAQQVASGAADLSTGTAEAAVNAQQLADGADQVANGTTQLVSGADSLSEQLASGQGQVPTYTTSQSESLSEVVTNPVVILNSSGDVASSVASTESVVPLSLAASLWVGALACFLLLVAVSREVLTSTETSTALTIRALLPAMLIVVGQSVLVAGIIGFATGLALATLALLVIAGVVAAVSFAALNQGLVALMGGFGRLVAAVMLTVTLATSLLSTAPAGLQSLSQALPTTMAVNAFSAVANGGSGLAASLAGLVVWGGIGLIAALVATSRARSTDVAAVLSDPVAATTQ